MYDITFTDEALEDLDYFRKPTRKRIVKETETYLKFQPNVETSKRKQMRTNELASWELRIGDYRVFYNIAEDEHVVDIVAIGWKEHNRLFIKGKETFL